MSEEMKHKSEKNQIKSGQNCKGRLTQIHMKTTLVYPIWYIMILIVTSFFFTNTNDLSVCLCRSVTFSPPSTSRRVNTWSRRSPNSALLSGRSWRRSGSAGRIWRAPRRPKLVSSSRPIRPTCWCRATRAWTNGWVSWRINWPTWTRDRTWPPSTSSSKNYRYYHYSIS